MIRLLIVDDSPISRKLVRRSLPEDLEFEIEEASDGARAVELYRELGPDLVLMDLIMPVMTGLEATEAIIEGHPEAKIIALTSDIQSTTKDRLQAAGVCEVLYKPIQRSELHRAIWEHGGDGGAR